jgi:hypothetical protein
VNRELPATDRDVETIIDLDRAEILSILRDVQDMTTNNSEERVDPFDWHRLR